MAKQFTGIFEDKTTVEVTYEKTQLDNQKIRCVKKGNVVQIYGTLNPNSDTPIAQTVFTIPIGYRPSASLSFPVFGGEYNNFTEEGKKMALLEVNASTGVVINSSLSKTITSGLYYIVNATWITA